MADPPLKRVKRKIRNSQNPLFEKWLKEWKNEAGKNGSEMQYCFNKALKSLQKFPLKLYSGKECMMLENFGTKICKMLDERLEKYKSMHPDDPDLFPKSSGKRNSISSLNINLSKENNVKKRKSSEITNSKKQKTDTETHISKTSDINYVPAYRSGAYAILLALGKKSEEADFKGFMTKKEIQCLAQDFCDTSFTKPVPGSYYTAWSSMGVLIRNKLVNKEGNPARFSLTENGMDLAIKLKELYSEKEKEIETPEKLIKSPTKSPSPVKVQDSPKQKSPRKTVSRSPPKKPKLVTTEKEPELVSEPEETIFLMPGSFEIKLLVDTQERDEKYQQSSSATMKQLKSRNVNFEIRHLKVGDFIWVAKDLLSGQELVLPYIVERKRMDDLASSIKDGRFHEQKFRLKQSGIENLIYLVEKYGNEYQRLGLPYPTLLQAISNTQVINGFNVKITNNHDDSMRYLDIMTNQLKNIFKIISEYRNYIKNKIIKEDTQYNIRFEDDKVFDPLNSEAKSLPTALDKTLMSCKKSNLSKANLSDDLISLMTFKDFNKGSEKSKKSTVRNMLVKHLLQLNGVSVEKASAIVQLYPTPKSLMEGLKRSNGEKSIAELTFGGFHRAIGPTTAKHIHLLYTSMNLQ